MLTMYPRLILFLQQSSVEWCSSLWCAAVCSLSWMKFCPSCCRAPHHVLAAVGADVFGPCRMHVVESVDPQFLRTVVVASKFDNR